jgi:hypothetical protein
MRKFILLFLPMLLILGYPAQAASSEQAYLRYLPDVPLLPGLAELADQSVIFDKAEGRVIESVAVSGVFISEQDVRNYYSRTLPSLGWNRTGPDRFLRNGEQLVVKWEKVQDGVIVRFSLSPKQGQNQGKNF